MAYSLTLASQSVCRVRPALGAIGLSGLPMLAYLAIRWPAIQGRLWPLRPSLGKVPGNVLVYLAQPFHREASS